VTGTSTLPVDDPAAPFGTWLRSWDLTPDGPPLRTHSSDLLPVRTATGVPAMLKLPREPHERRGSLLMRWWSGAGAAHVFAAGEGGALLLERATGTRSLAAWSRDGNDDEAMEVLCRALMRLHAPRTSALPDGLLPLRIWFDDLEPAARVHGGVLRRASDIARRLLDAPEDVVPLHGDLHHDNVLDFGPQRGWLAIDPKGLLGERGFDYGNLFSNPQPPGEVRSEVALQPGVFERRFEVVAREARVERTRLLQWIVAYSGLSAAWIIGDGDDPSLDIGVAERALALLDTHAAPT
jgi:streptomycin 6-kinase